MKYKVTHLTSYHYHESVPICHNEIRLTPREGGFQHCKFHRLVVKPAPSSFGKRLDYFGNHLTYFSLHEGHRKLSVTAVSRVEVVPRTPPSLEASPPWDSFREELRHSLHPTYRDALQFVYDSPDVETFAELVQYAQPSFPPGRPLLAGVRELTARVKKDFQYDPRATQVHTRVRESFRLRRGVCQDFAHIQIACLRALGLAARYVSGYLRTLPPPGKPRLIGADASHAWLSVFAGGLGWIDFDPTNDVIPNTDHITLAWGRDYDDVAPIKGVFVGGGRSNMTVSVDVAPLQAIA